METRDVALCIVHGGVVFCKHSLSLAHAQFRENRASQRGRVHAPDFASVVSLDHQEQWFARPLVIEKRRERVRVRGEHLERLVAVVEDYFF